MTFAFGSLVTNTTHEGATVDAVAQERREARIVSGMHVRTSNLAGGKPGVEVARLAARRRDERR